MSIVGTIEVIASIDTSKYKSGANEVDAANKRMESSTNKSGNSLQKLGGRLATMAKTGVKVAAVSLAGLATTIGALSIGGGISRALNIEDAQAKLKGLGHDAESVENIMNSALDSVLGTSYGLDAAATIAASAVAAGIKPGQELTKYLSLTADAATIAGTSLDEMGSIFNKVQTGQKAYTQELNQLSERGIPIYQWLQKELNVTQEELRDMVAAGKVDSETYFKAIQNNIGGAALESGKTTRGAFANLLAAMSSIGAKIVTGPIDKIRKGFLSITQWIKDNSEDIVSSVQSILDYASRLGKGFLEVLPSVIKLARQVGNYLVPKIMDLYSAIRSNLLPALMGLWKDVIQPLVPSIGRALVGAVGLFIDALRVTVNVVSGVVSAIKPMLPAIVGLTAAWASYRLTVIAINTAKAISNGLFILQAGLLKAHVAALMLMRGATIAQTVATLGLNTALIASPIGLVAAAIGGLVAAYVVATSQTNSVKNATDRLNSARQQQKVAADAAKLAEDNLKGAQLGAESASIALARAQERLTSLQESGTASALDLREASHAVAEAQNSLKAANDRVNTATRENSKAQQELANKEKAVAASEANKRAALDPTTRALNWQKDAVSTLSFQLDALNGKTVTYNVRGNVDNQEAARAAGYSSGAPFKRYKGGPVSANRPYIVGENPDGSLNSTSELFVPRSAGRIINAKDLQSAIGGGGSGITNNIQNVTIASEVDGERWLRRLSGDQEIVSNGLVPRQSYM